MLINLCTFRTPSTIKLGVFILIPLLVMAYTTPPDVPEATSTAISLQFTPTAEPTATDTVQPTATWTVMPPATETPTVTPTPLPTATPSPSPTPVQIDHVIIISIDGLRPDALVQADTPVLDALMAQGAYSDHAQAVMPSVTLVNHASMLSGMSPEKHGIMWNTLEPDAGYIPEPTLFSEAKAAGLTTAMFVGKPKLSHIAIPGTIDRYVEAGFTDQMVMNATLDSIEQDGLAHLTVIHLPDVDSAGHMANWMSSIQLMTVGWTDSTIGQLLQLLRQRDELDHTVLIISSDHGGTDNSHGSDVPEDMTIPWLVVGPGIPIGQTITDDITTYDTAATALHLFGLPIPDVWDGRSVLDFGFGFESDK